MTTVWVFVKIISISDEELFSETVLGYTATYLVLNYIMFPLVFNPHHLRICFPVFAVADRLAVSQSRMSCLVLNTNNVRVKFVFSQKVVCRFGQVTYFLPIG